jgi:hypothetical protein
MKLIEAMKKIKVLTKKAEDLKTKVAQHCADLDYETPIYGNEAEQTAQINNWIQAHHDLLKEILRLRVALQKTNLVTSVVVVLGETPVTKTIAEWIHRRRDLSQMELLIWRTLGDRGLKEGRMQSTVPGVPSKEVKIRRYYDPRIRDEKINLYAAEATIIDSSLEVANAITDLIEE